MKLKINEIFYSIQGESSYTGLPCIFIRLTYCNLRCSYCDTEYAFYDGKDIEIKRVFHESSPAIARYFDPYVGAGHQQNMLDGFGWGSMTPAVQFTMMPLNLDLLRVQAIELNDQFRKSSYSFELIMEELKC